ncbi:MAG: hypothetical protein PF569_04040 [Candidatus Woesearchaeota archaeon]|jgi:hypothetical protein|nr:hypothetical protein [Candidatus Woesearchaeota archaeon]
MLNKKGNISLGIKTIVMALIIVIIFVTYMIILLQASKVNIEEKKLKTQLITNKFFTSKCLGNEFATIEDNNYNQDLLQKCFKNIDNDILFRIQIENKKDFIYSTTKEEFIQKMGLCGITKSNQLCTKMAYPVTYIEDEEYSTETLIFEIITTN